MGGAKGSRIAASAFSLLQCYRRHDTPLLPNLVSLTWNLTKVWNESYPPSILPFLSTKLLNLDIRLILDDCPERREALSSFWRSFTDQTPNLRTLVVRTGDGDADHNDIWDDEASVWLRTCRSLKSITVPRRWHCPDTLTALGSLPNLEVIRVHRSGEIGTWILCDYVANISFLSHWCRNGTFPRLRALGFDDSFTKVINSLQLTSPKLTRVEELSFGKGDTVETAREHLPAMLSRIVASCTSLRSICVDLSCVEDNWTPEPLSFEAFRTLLSCPSLEKVDIKDNQPIQLQDTDIVDMGRAWPRLTSLTVESAWSLADADYPSAEGRWDLNHLGVPIRWLSNFAAHMPNLEHIGLQVHPTTPPSFSRNLPTLGRLRTLSLGTSTVPGEGADLAFFLAALCPSDVELSWSAHRLEVADNTAWGRAKEEFGRASRVKEWNFGR